MASRGLQGWKLRLNHWCGRGLLRERWYTAACLVHKINLILPERSAQLSLSLSFPLFPSFFFHTRMHTFQPFQPFPLRTSRYHETHNGGDRERSARFKRRRRRRVFGIGSRGELRGGLRGSIVKTDSFCSAARTRVMNVAPGYALPALSTRQVGEWSPRVYLRVCTSSLSLSASTALYHWDQLFAVYRHAFRAGIQR